jgi:hypothetical protein
MILKDHSEVESESDGSQDDKIQPLEDCSYERVAYLVEREALVIRHI